MSVHRSYNILRSNGAIETVEVEIDLDYVPPGLHTELREWGESLGYQGCSADEIRTRLNLHAKDRMREIFRPFVEDLESRLDALPAGRSDYCSIVGCAYDLAGELQSYLQDYALEYDLRKSEANEKKKETT